MHELCNDTRSKETAYEQPRTFILTGNPGIQTHQQEGWAEVTQRKERSWTEEGGDEGNGNPGNSKTEHTGYALG